MSDRGGFLKLNFFLMLVMVLALTHCQVEGPDDGQPDANPIPFLTTISPTSTVANLPSFTLTVKGAGFTLESQILFNGNIMQTFYVSTDEIACLVQPGDTNISGSRSLLNLDGDKQGGSETVEVFVRNPPPGGGDSDPVNFIIRDNHAFGGPTNTGASPLAVHPDITVDESGYIYLLYGDLNGNHGAIHFQRSTNLGQTWSAPAVLAVIDAVGNLADLKVNSNGMLMAVFCRPVSSVYNVHFTVSSDQGSNWTIAKNISNTVYHCSQPVVAFDRHGAGVVAWREYLSKGQANIYLARSTDGGSSWHTPVNGSRLTNSDQPSMAFDNDGHLWLVFQEYSKVSDVYINYSSDGGKGWATPLRIPAPNGLNTDPRLAVSGQDDVYLVWKNDSPLSKSEIYFIHAAGAASPSTAQNISNSAEKWSNSPDIYVDGAGNINVVYMEDGKIYYIRSSDKGQTWSAKNRLDTRGSAGFPRISARNGGYIDVVFVASSLFYCGSTR